jgi:hypothetical protein
MKKIEEKYTQLCMESSDINEHLPTIKKYAEECDHITEMGVRWVVSTYAFMMGYPKKLISIDILPVENFGINREDLKNLAYENNIDFEFAIGNSLELDIEPCDLLFIDTVHKRAHCLAELDRHAKNAQRYIVLHDPSDWPGVFEAVIIFLHHNREWHIVEHCNKESGLLVLERYND